MFKPDNSGQQRMKNAFIKKINWKFYNYIKNLLTYIEDKEGVVSLDVSTYCDSEYTEGKVDTLLIHMYNTIYEDRYAWADIEKRIKYSNINGLIYIVSFINYYSEEGVKNIVDKIKKHSKIIYLELESNNFLHYIFIPN